MPQLQKANPAVTAAFRKFLRVAVLLLPQFLLALFYPLPAFRRTFRRVDAK
jgi:hypothetical protein